MSEQTTETTDSRLQPARRRFLMGAGVLSLAAVAAACGDDDDSGSTAATGGDESTTSGSGSSDRAGDSAILATAASLEVLAVSTYGAALEAATSGALGEVPPAVAEFVTVAQAQHQEQLDRLNEALTESSQPEVSDPPSDLAEAVNAQFAGVTDVAGAAELALMLEETAAQTYLAAIPVLTDPALIEAAGAICCIDRQHAAILRFVLGQYPVPDVFAPTDMAYSG